MPDDSENVREALLRWAAVGAWAEHALAGRCSIETALDAIGRLEVDAWLFGNEAA